MSAVLLLFARQPFVDAFQKRLQGAFQSINQIDPDSLLSSPSTDLVDQFFEICRFEMPTLHHELAHSTGVQETRLVGPSGNTSVPGVLFAQRIPFDGDPELFQYRSNPFQSGGLAPEGLIEGQELVIEWA